MSMAATANARPGKREEGSSPLLLSARALRRPVAASLLLHVSICATLVFWWQSGTPAPKGMPDGLSVTFVELSEPAPAAPVTAAPVVDTEPVIERREAAVPLPEPVAMRPEPQPEPDPQPRPSEARMASQTSAPAAPPVASLAPPDPRDSTGESAAPGQRRAEGAASDDIIITTPRFRAKPRPPVYPNRARDLAQEGVAMVRVKLDPLGNAAEVTLLESSGYALLDHAAIRAARGWQFEPERRGGRPVIAWVHIPVHFALR